MGCLAAARLKYHYGQPGIDYEKILHLYSMLKMALNNREVGKEAMV